MLKKFYDALKKPKYDGKKVKFTLRNFTPFHVASATIFKFNTRNFVYQATDLLKNNAKIKFFRTKTTVTQQLQKHHVEVTSSLQKLRKNFRIFKFYSKAIRRKNKNISKYFQGKKTKIYDNFKRFLIKLIGARQLLHNFKIPLKQNSLLRLVINRKNYRSNLNY